MSLEDVQTFSLSLREALRSYQGEYKDVISYIPEFYDFFLNILDESGFPAEMRLYTNAAIAYLVSPIDVIPEDELVGEGFLDDAFLCAYIAKILLVRFGDEATLEANWGHDQSLRESVEFVLANVDDVIDEETQHQILKYVGIREDE